MTRPQTASLVVTILGATMLIINVIAFYHADPDMFGALASLLTLFGGLVALLCAPDSTKL